MIPTSSHFVCHWKAAWWTPKIRMQRFALEWEFLFEIRRIFNILFMYFLTALLQSVLCVLSNFTVTISVSSVQLSWLYRCVLTRHIAMNDFKCKTAHFVNHMISVSVTICLLAFPTVKSHWSKNPLQVVTLNIVIFWLVDIVSRFLAVLCSGDYLLHCAWLGHTKMLFNVFHFHAQFTLLFKSL